jgi:hypothetical protein
MAEREGLSGGFIRSPYIPRKAAITAGYGILGGLHGRLLFCRARIHSLVMGTIVEGRNIPTGPACRMVKALRY